MVEYNEILELLINKTEHGKIEWHPTCFSTVDRIGDLSIYNSSFSCSIDDVYVLIYRTSNHRDFSKEEEKSYSFSMDRITIYNKDYKDILDMLWEAIVLNNDKMYKIAQEKQKNKLISGLAAL